MLLPYTAHLKIDVFLIAKKRATLSLNLPVTTSVKHHIIPSITTCEWLNQKMFRDVFIVRQTQRLGNEKSKKICVWLNKWNEDVQKGLISKIMLLLPVSRLRQAWCCNLASSVYVSNAPQKLFLNFLLLFYFEGNKLAAIADKK